MRIFLKISTFILFSSLSLGFVFFNVDSAKAASCLAASGACVSPWEGTQVECEIGDGSKYWPKDGCGEKWCFCSDNISDIKESNYTTANTNFISTCELVVGACNENSVERLGPGGTKYFSCRQFNDDEASKTTCEAADSAWKAQKVVAITKFGGFVAGQKASGGSMFSRIIPDCALGNDLGPENPCRDITIFVALGINVAGYLFGIVGALALLMFIYGGITLVISMGNPEKVKKGGEILMSSVLGLIIVFGAYILVKFLGEALGVTSNLL